jgi:hypothetical protein
MCKIHHRDLIPMVCRTVTDIASQMDRITVREARHRSMTAQPKPEAHPARFVVTAISVIALVPFAINRCVRLSGQ